MTPFYIRIVFAVLLLTSQWSSALPNDAEQPLLLEAETLEYDELGGTITYSGSVVMQQGSMKINAEKVVIHGDIDRATKVIATGQPARFQQTPEAASLPVKANAKRLEYKVQNKALFLQGDATLKQEGTSLSGNTIEYDVKNALVKAGSTLVGSDKKKRVKMVIPPKLLESDK